LHSQAYIASWDIQVGQQGKYSPKIKTLGSTSIRKGVEAPDFEEPVRQHSVEDVSGIFGPATKRGEGLSNLFMFETSFSTFYKKHAELGIKPSINNILKTHLVGSALQFCFCS